MENNPTTGKRKLRLNVFDIVIIVCAIIAAVLIINYSSRSDSGASIIPAGSQKTITYTLELHGMRYGSAELIRVGDTLIDNVERRALGTIVSFELKPAMTLQSSVTTGDRVIVEIPERVDAFLTVRALVTEMSDSVNSFIEEHGEYENGYGRASFPSVWNPEDTRDGGSDFYISLVRVYGVRSHVGIL